MKTVTQHLRDHITRHLGLKAFQVGAKGDDFETILDHQLDWAFLRAVALKAVMGWYRYGDNRDPQGSRHDHLERIERELAKYRATGNVYHLEEIAIYAMLEAIKAPLGRGTLQPERVHRAELDDVESDESFHSREIPKT